MASSDSGGSDGTGDGDVDATRGDVGVAETMQSGERPIPRAPKLLTIETERYQMVALLGRGGMGEVHKAFDPRLGRFIALKVMRQASPELAARLVYEARAQARVDHEHVCKVYGVGELGGLPFIALQFIDGPTLRQLAPKLTREQKIAIMHDVADALHAAHRQGLVHRDVKPGNVLVEKGEDGFKAFVTDFGIAREVDGPGVTKTGVAQGTPLYMAPEQARGEAQKIDRRTDVYGLGATLYDLLSGRPPFQGDTSLGVMLKVLHDDPQPLRTIDPSIPVDLETITMKCLEKDPVRRYDSARALAQDLQAWLDGDPIAARRGGIGYRLLKRARKNLAIVVSTAIVLVAGAVLGGYAWRERRTADMRAAVAHEFGQDVERNDAIARYASLLPLHDTRRERAMIEARMAKLTERMAELGSLAEGPGRYALGRGWLTLERPDDARRELERAWQLGYRAPEVSYALGLALSQQYLHALAETAADASDKQELIARRAELERRFRAPALAYLKSAVGLQLEAPEYVEGLIALHEHSYTLALDKARAAQARVPWMFEAHTLEGDIRLTLAKDDWTRGEPAQALAELDRAGAAYRTASDMAHSNVGALHGSCLRWALAAEIASHRDQSPKAATDGALAACGQALQAWPDDGALYIDQVQALLSLARYDATHNGDPLHDWDRADQLAGEALRIDAKDVPSRVALAAIEDARAGWELDHGADPRPRIERAIGAIAEALARDPRSYEARLIQSHVYMVRGDWEAGHGLDPRHSYETSADSGMQARVLSADGWRTFAAVGLAELSKGMWEATNGVDPQPSLTQAVQSYGMASQKNPNVDYGYLNECAAWLTLGEYQHLRNVDPLPSFDRAIAACGRSEAVDPDFAGTHYNLGYAHVDRALWLRDQGLDPTPDLTKAEVFMQRALAVEHEYTPAFTSRGEIELTAARWAADHGRSPIAHFTAARAAVEHALVLNASDPDTERELGEICRWQAEWRAAHHEP
ncbi:MAG TPA: protein kinase, partial [Polyangia bacterium]|nr:protein kinase [Polyangia bacterium]